MKSGKIFTILIGVLFISIAAATALNFKLYKECNDKIDLSAKQFKFLNDKMNDFEMNISSFKLNLEDFKVDYEKYKKDLSGKITPPEQLRSEINNEIEGLKKELQSVQENYKTIENNIQEKLNSIKKEIETSAQGGSEKVNLGEISVKTSQEPVKK